MDEWPYALNPWGEVAPPPVPPPLWRYGAWLAAWIACSWFGVLVIDWSFAPFLPAVVVLVVVAAWLGLGVNVLVQALRHGRRAPVPRVLLLAFSLPFAVAFQITLAASAVGPPSDICLMTEFRRNHAEFERLASVLDLLAPIEADDGKPPPPADSFLPGLGCVSLRRRGCCHVELIRWTRSVFGYRLEEGFVYSPVAPGDLVPSDDEGRPLRVVRSYSSLDGPWHVFRAVR